MVPSLVDAPSLLTDTAWQKRVRSGLVDKELTERWLFHDRVSTGRDYPDLLDWAVSKLDDLANDETLRSVLGGEHNTVNIDRVVRNNGVLVVSIPESVIGRDSAQFLGSLVLLQLKAALLRRKGDDVPPFFVYVDEFQKFASVGFEELLAEARKFGVGLVMAHQNLEQLRAFSLMTGLSSDALVNSILGNVGTMVVFPIGAQDANLLAPQIEVSAKNIGRLGRYEAVVKMTLRGQSLAPFTLRTEYSNPGLDPRRLDEIREYLVEGDLIARQKDVQARIANRRRSLRSEKQPPAGPGRMDEAAGIAFGSKPRERTGAGIKPPDPKDGSPSVLDEWLLKRKKVPSAPARGEAVDALTKAEDDKTQPNTGERTGSWADVIGPVMRLKDVARLTPRAQSQSAFRFRDAGRHGGSASKSL